MRRALSAMPRRQTVQVWLRNAASGREAASTSMPSPTGEAPPERADSTAVTTAATAAGRVVRKVIFG